MALNRLKIENLYRKRAERYDLTPNLYYLIGFREWHCRQRAVDALQLKGGDVFVALGSESGLCFNPRAVGHWHCYESIKLMGFQARNGLDRQCTNSVTSESGRL